MKITFLKNAEKTLTGYDKPIRIHLAKAILNLPSGDIARLQGKGRLKLYRLRVGKYRVVFEWNGDEIVVAKIDSRGDVYKD